MENVTRARAVTLRCLRHVSSVLRERSRSADLEDSPPACLEAVTHPFFNTMFCTHMPYPQQLRLTESNKLWIDSPLQLWMDNVMGYFQPAVDNIAVSPVLNPDFMSMFERLSNILAVLVVACSEQNHARIMKDFLIVLDVICWTRYFMIKQRFMFPDGYTEHTGSTKPALIAFWRYEDMQEVSGVTAEPGSIKFVVNSMFGPNGDGDGDDDDGSNNPLADCEAVYDYILSRMTRWYEPGKNMSMSLFCYGLQAVFLRALYQRFPVIVGTDDHRAALTKHWSCTMHREIECKFQVRQMMHNQINAAQLEEIASKRCKDDPSKRVVAQTSVPEMFKGVPRIGTRVTKLDVNQPVTAAVSTKARGSPKDKEAFDNRLPTQPKFYSAPTFWRLLVELWLPDTPVVQSDWCTDERCQHIDDIYSQAMQKSQVHGETKGTFDEAAVPSTPTTVTRLTAVQMRDEQTEKLQEVKKQTKEKLEKQLSKKQQQQQRRSKKASGSQADDDDNNNEEAVPQSNSTVSKAFPSFAGKEVADSRAVATAAAKITEAVRDLSSDDRKGPKRKRAPRKWSHARSQFHVRCQKLVEQIKFDVVQSLPYYGRIILACHSGSCHVEPPLDADSAHVQALSNPEKMPLQTHTRKKRRVFSQEKQKRDDATATPSTPTTTTVTTTITPPVTRRRKTAKSVAIVKKPSPTGPCRAFMLHLFQATVNDSVWREPVLGHKDTACSLVLYRDRGTKQFKFGYSVPRDIDPLLSFRFTELPRDTLLGDERPKCYDALQPKSGFGDKILRGVVKNNAWWNKWRGVICNWSFVNSKEWTADTERYCLYRIAPEVACVCPRDLALTPFELALLLHPLTFHRLHKRHMVTWYLLLSILYQDKADVYRNLRMVCPSLTPWSFERAVLSFDKAMDAVHESINKNHVVLGFNPEALEPVAFTALSVSDQAGVLARAWRYYRAQPQQPPILAYTKQLNYRATIDKLRTKIATVWDALADLETTVSTECQRNPAAKTATSRFVLLDLDGMSCCISSIAGMTDPGEDWNGDPEVLYVDDDEDDEDDDE